jgi:hypothetical protein
MAVMHWLWIVLSCLFPRDPVRQCIEALREQVRQTAQEAFDIGLHALESDAALRCTLEAIIIEYETTLHLVIAGRACRIAGLRFDPGERFFPEPTHPKSALELFARLNDLIKALDRIEHLAQLRAIKLTRERDADPLGLNKHPKPMSSLAEGGGGGARALARVTACRAEAQRRREGTARKAGGSTRAPPVFDVFLKPKPASQAHLRERDPVPEWRISPPRLSYPACHDRRTARQGHSTTGPSPT